MPKAHTPTSVLLSELLEGAHPDQVSLEWLVRHLGRRSFGLVMLVLALLGVLPGASVMIGVLIVILAVQMILGRADPAFPRRLASWRFRTRHLTRILRRVIPALRYIEAFIHPRWPTPFLATKRVIGVMLLLTGCLLFAPIPFSNVPPALTILLISVAYLEEDGVLLCISLVASSLLLAVAAGTVWQVMSEMGWVEGLLWN